MAEPKPEDLKLMILRNSYLGSKMGGITDENDEVEEITCRINQKEKALDKHLERIEHIYQMISEMYRNGPTRCLKPIPDRPPIPLAATPKPVCLNNNPSRPEHNKPRQRNDRRQTIDDWRQRRWRRTNTLFRRKDRHFVRYSPKVKSVFKLIKK